MASKKISALTELTAPADVDQLVIVDKSDTAMAASGTDKRITVTNLLGAVLSALQELAPAADRLPYFDGVSTAALAALTTYARSLLDDPDAATARGTLGLGAAAVADIGAGSTQVAAGNDSRFPTAGQKNALAGTSGVPGAINTYVTDQDGRNTNARTPTAHKASHATGGSDALAPADIGAESVANKDTDAALAANSDVKYASQKAAKAYVDTATGLLVPKSLVDAKGDLLVGTADNTPARKAVGADSTYLRADSTQADGLAWGTLPTFSTPRFRSGSYHAPPGLASQGFGDPNSTVNRLLALVLPVARRTTFDRIGFWLQANYGAGSIARLGVYSIRTGLHPDVPLVDSGDIACDAGAPVWKEAVINLTLDPGVYLAVMEFKTGWTVGAGQMLRVLQGTMIGAPGTNDNSAGPSNLGIGTTTGGALPNPGPDLSGSTGINVPCIKLRVA